MPLSRGFRRRALSSSEERVTSLDAFKQAPSLPPLSVLQDHFFTLAIEQDRDDTNEEVMASIWRQSLYKQQKVRGGLELLTPPGSPSRFTFAHSSTSTPTSTTTPSSSQSSSRPSIGLSKLRQGSSFKKCLITPTFLQPSAVVQSIHRWRDRRRDNKQPQNEEESSILNSESFLDFGSSVEDVVYSSGGRQPPRRRIATNKGRSSSPFSTPAASPSSGLSSNCSPTSFLCTTPPQPRLNLSQPHPWSTPPPVTFSVESFPTTKIRQRRHPSQLPPMLPPPTKQLPSLPCLFPVTSLTTLHPNKASFSPDSILWQGALDELTQNKGEQKSKQKRHLDVDHSTPITLTPSLLTPTPRTDAFEFDLDETPLPSPCPSTTIDTDFERAVDSFPHPPERLVSVNSPPLPLIQRSSLSSFYSATTTQTPSLYASAHDTYHSPLYEAEEE